MANLLPQGKQYFTTATGAPLVGGKLYTYDAGTLNPRLTYSDAAATAPNANPVILDSRGEAIIFWSGGYKVILKDSLDATIWTVDQILQGGDFVNLTVTGNTVLGDAAGDTLTISSSAVTWSNNPIHSGNHTFSGNVTLGDAQADTVTIGGVLHKAATGAWTWPAPSAGVLAIFNGFAGSNVVNFSGGASNGIIGLISTAAAAVGVGIEAKNSVQTWQFGLGVGVGDSSWYLSDTTRGAQPLKVTITGAVSIPAPSAGTSLTVAQVSGGTGILLSTSLSGANVTYQQTNGSNTANSNVRHVLQSTGASGGDAWYEVQNQTTIWSWGLDISDASAWVLAASAALGTSNALRISTTGNITAVATAGTLGYGTGAGGAVTQATDKSTGVTLNKGAGVITMNTASLAAGTSVSFVLTNTLIAATDVVAISIQTGVALGGYVLTSYPAAAGGAVTITLRNVSAGALAEVVVLNYAVIKAVNA